MAERVLAESDVQIVDVNAIRFVKELYPRIKQDDDAIERYRAALDRLPPVIIARDGILVDGFHRWQAFLQEGRSEIAVMNLGNLSDAEIVRESIRRNATHGQQLSRADKQRLAGILWRDFAALKPAERLSELVDLLSVSRDSVERWTHDARASELAEVKAKALDLHLDCLSDVGIAQSLRVTDKTAKDYWTSEFAAHADFSEPPRSRQDFDLWRFDDHHGEVPPQAVENLLWFFTQPDQIVIDAFAGRGTSVEVCKQMGRRVWASDPAPRNPLLPIHQHDIARDGWPQDAPKKADLILLHAPFWCQSLGKGGKREDDLTGMALGDFSTAWEHVIAACVPHLAPHGHIAYMVAPSLMEHGEVIDLAMDMLPACWEAGLRVAQRIVVLYPADLWSDADVRQAEQERRDLPLYRDLVVLARAEDSTRPPRLDASRVG